MPGDSRAKKPARSVASSKEASQLAQWERANQVWQLRIGEGEAALGTDRLRILTKALRTKRMEKAALIASLPGVVRSGARIDLDPVFERLKAGGVTCSLERRPITPPHGLVCDPSQQTESDPFE